MERLIELLGMLVTEMRDERLDRRSHYVTKGDLMAAKTEIIQAFGARVDPGQLNKLTSELEKSGATLKQAVEAAK